MSSIEETKIATTAAANDETVQKEVTNAEEVTAKKIVDVRDAAIIEQERAEKILKAKELYSHGSRNFLVKNYAEAADELSEVCALYVELYGELSDELGMPYLLYAKSLIALALDENKVIDVPDAEDDDDEEDVGDVDEEQADAAATAASSSSSTAKRNGSATKLESIKENGDEADSTGDAAKSEKTDVDAEKAVEDTEVSSSGAEADDNTTEEEAQKSGSTSTSTSTAAAADNEKPSTSNGEAVDGAEEEEDEDNEAASSLQLAWEILELAAKIFSRQGLSGLPNLAEVQTELANIEFENSILDAAREDYEKALKIYLELPTNYRRAMAEIHYKIGLTYLMQQMNKEGASSLKDACTLIEAEIESIQERKEPTEKDKNTIQDLEETKQEIWAKITEIEEMQAQTMAEVRKALDNYIKPTMGGDAADDAASSSSATTKSAPENGKATDAATASSSAISSSSKPTDISHLIKRKKPEEPNSEAEALCSPAKRAAV